MIEFFNTHWLDIVTTVLGFIYIVLEYRASIYLWFIGIIMPALDIWLYFSHGLYGDAGMAVYYTCAAVYGYAVWQYSSKKGTHGSTNLPISHMPKRLYLPATMFFVAAWALTYFILVKFTNSTVPLLDAFTNALSFVGLWSLARKYIEQWMFWVVVDIISCYLYINKDIPFKALLYGAYVIIAIAGYVKWKNMMNKQSNETLRTN